MRYFAMCISIAAMCGATTAMADNKSECEKGVAMIKSELGKKHSASVVAILKKALNDAEDEMIENDWSECLSKIKPARAALKR